MNQRVVPELSKVIQNIFQIAKQGGISQKTGNNVIKGGFNSKDFEKLFAIELVKLKFNDLTDEWEKLKNLEPSFFSIPYQYKQNQSPTPLIELKDRIKKRLFDCPMDSKDIKYDPGCPLPRNAFICQAGGSQYAVDIMVNINDYIIYIELKTGGGKHGKLNDRIPFASSIVILVSSSKTKTYRTGRTIEEKRFHKRTGKPLKSKFKSEKIPNPWLGEPCEYAFQYDMISVINYSKVDTIVAKAKEYLKQLNEEAGFDDTLKSVWFRPIINPGMSNMKADWEANSINKTCIERRNNVLSTLKKIENEI